MADEEELPLPIAEAEAPIADALLAAQDTEDAAMPSAATAVVAGADGVSGTAATQSAWFSQWAQMNNVEEFAQLLSTAGLTPFVETCETPLTIFVPNNEAIRNMRHTLPTDVQLLHELLCVHITMGSLRCAPRVPAWRTWTRAPRPPPLASPRTACSARAPIRPAPSVCWDGDVRRARGLGNCAAHGR